jgi:hypothetical protein
MDLVGLIGVLLLPFVGVVLIGIGYLCGLRDYDVKKRGDDDSN